jgi:regulatory protein
MNDDKPFRQALGRALNLISYRQRTEHELRERLGERFELDVIDRAITHLKEQGLVDDEAFAHAWSDSRTRNSPRSARALVREMTTKGVARSLADAAVLDLDDEGTARMAAAKFARRLVEADYEQFHRRLWQHLQRRGYGGSVARRVASDLWEKREASEGHTPGE